MITAYIVTCDLKAPPGSYKSFYEEIRKGSSWWHYMRSTWIVITDRDMGELGKALRSHIRPRDRFLIMPAVGPTQGWLPPKAWEWLNEHLPED